MKLVATLLTIALSGWGTVAPSQTVLFSDEFNAPTLSTAWVVVDPGTITTGPELLLSTVGNTQVLLSAGPNAWTNYVASAWINASSTPASPAPVAFLRTRFDPVGGTWLEVRLDPVGNSIDVVTDAGVVLDSAPYPNAILGGWVRVDFEVVQDRLEVRAQGTPVLFYQGTEVGSRPSGGIGLGVRSGQAGAAASARFEDLEVVEAESLTLTLSQPSGPGSIRITNDGGQAGEIAFTALSFDSANAGPGLGTGLWFGLHISVFDIATQYLAGAPFRQFYDAQGTTNWELPAGSVPTVLPPLYGVTTTLDAGSPASVLQVSNLAVLQGSVPQPPPSYAYQLSSLGFTGSNRHAVLEDFTGDGQPDLAVSSGLWRNDGGLAYSILQIDPGGVEAEVADMNGDGLPDLIVLDQVFDGLRIFPGQPGGTFDLASPTLLPVFCTDRGDVRVTDFDLDGDLDLLVSSGITASPGVTQWMNDGTGTFFLLATFGVDSVACEAADLDGDGSPDFVVSLSPSGGNPAETAVLLGDQSPTYTLANGFSLTPILPDPLTRWVRARDLNGDGLLDLVWAGDADAGALLNQGGTPPSFTYLPFPAAPDATYALQRLTLSDIDDDGDDDVVFLTTVAGERYLVLCPNDGSGAFPEAWYIAVPGQGRAFVLSADLDGDGDEDLVIGGSPSPMLVLENQN